LTIFFIPELDPLEASAEDVYAGIRQAAHAETGHSPQERRIFKLGSVATASTLRPRSASPIGSVGKRCSPSSTWGDGGRT
jgi:hypothetical protein